MSNRLLDESVEEYLSRRVGEEKERAETAEEALSQFISNLQQEIDRLEKQIAEYGTPYCPPSKGMSSEIGELMGLNLRCMIFKDALRFAKEGPPS